MIGYILKNSWEELVYEVEKIDIVTPNDVDAVKIRPGKDMVTLLTCHPYGSNGKYRYLVYCSRVKDAGKDDRKKEVSYAYKDHIVASDGQIYSLSSKDIQKEKYFRWLCAIILFLYNGSHENKRYVEEKEADIDCEERKEQEY